MFIISVVFLNLIIIIKFLFFIKYKQAIENKTKKQSITNVIYYNVVQSICNKNKKIKKIKNMDTKTCKTMAVGL